MINVTKNDETKIYKTVQEFTKLVKQNDGNKKSGDRSKTSEQSKFANTEYFGGGKKWKKTLISSLIITLVNQKKKLRDEKNKAVQHDTNKITKLSNQHILQRGERRRFVWQKLCFRHLCLDDKKYQSIFFGKKNVWRKGQGNDKHVLGGL